MEELNTAFLNDEVLADKSFKKDFKSVNNNNGEIISNINDNFNERETNLLDIIDIDKNIEIEALRNKEVNLSNYKILIPEEALIEQKKDVFIQSTSQLLNGLNKNFRIDNTIIFKDLDENKICVINENIEDVFDRTKYYHTQTIQDIFKNMLENLSLAGKLNQNILSDNHITNKLKEALNSMKKAYRLYEDEFFIDSDNLSTFNLFKATPLLKYEQKGIKISFDNLREIIKKDFKHFNILLENNIGDDEHIKWFLNWVSSVINERTAIKTTFCIIGEQGSGKSVLVDTIFRDNVFDKSNYNTIDNKTIKEKFNEINNYKAFNSYNEISTLDLKENNQVTQDLKRLITDDTIIIRGMNKAPIEKLRTFNMCFTTNKNAPLQVEAGDRRFTFFGRALNLRHRDDFIALKIDMETFIKNVKQEIKEALYLVKLMDYNISYANIPLENELKARLIATTNTKEDILKSAFNTKKFSILEDLLNNNGIDILKDSEVFMHKLEQMFNEGIFTNDILNTLYKIIFDKKISEDTEKTSSSYFSKILKSDSKFMVKYKGQVLRFKIYNSIEDDVLSIKKENLRKILDDVLIIDENHNKLTKLSNLINMSSDGLTEDGEDKEALLIEQELRNNNMMEIQNRNKNISDDTIIKDLANEFIEDFK